MHALPHRLHAGVEVIDRITRQGGAEHAANVALLESLCDTMQHGSLCAMGGMTPIRCALRCSTIRRTSVSSPCRP
jgi:NADH:ubiquinone oxidoreductase subunit F (NADH-binding)